MRINRTRKDPESTGQNISEEMATSPIPAVVWFLRGGDETLADGTKQSRKPGTLSITLDRSGTGYRISLKDPSSGFVAFHTLDALANALQVVDRLLDGDDLNWIVDKFNHRK